MSGGAESSVVAVDVQAQLIREQQRLREQEEERLRMEEEERVRKEQEAEQLKEEKVSYWFEHVTTVLCLLNCLSACVFIATLMLTSFMNRFR